MATKKKPTKSSGINTHPSEREKNEKNVDAKKIAEKKSLNYR